MVALAASESSSPVRSRRRRRRRRRHFGVLTSIFAAAAALFLLVASSSSSVPSAEALAAAKKAVIRVCQNQDCRKRWRKLSGLSGASLPETFRDLLLPSDDSSIRIEPSGCLSRCGEGPNVQVDVDDNASGASSSSSVVVFNGVNDVVEAAVAVLGSPPLDIDVPPKLLAAASLTEKALKATRVEDREKYLSSVVKALASEPELERSSARIRAQVLRAEARCDGGRYEKALEDVSDAVAFGCGGGDEESEAEGAGGTPPAAATTIDVAPLLAKAHRVAADAHEGLGQLDEAMESVRKWSSLDPAFTTKAAGEIQRLLQKQQQQQQN